MARFKVILALVLIVLSLLLVLLNAQAVETRFFFWTITMPQAALLGITLLTGIAIGLLLALILLVKRPKAGKAAR